MLKAHWDTFRERVAEQRSIRLRTRELMPDYTGRAILVLLALALLVGAALIFMADATAEPQTMYVCTETDPLNVRDAPDIHADWVFRLDRGEAVVVLEIKHGWAYVERCGDYGWAWAEYLGENPPVDKLPEGWLEVEPD